MIHVWYTTHTWTIRKNPRRNSDICSFQGYSCSGHHKDSTRRKSRRIPRDWPQKHPEAGVLHCPTKGCDTWCIPCINTFWTWVFLKDGYITQRIPSICKKSVFVLCMSDVWYGFKLYYLQLLTTLRSIYIHTASEIFAFCMFDVWFNDLWLLIVTELNNISTWIQKDHL